MLKNFKKKFYLNLNARNILGMNSTAKCFSVEDAMTNDLYFTISEIKLSIISLYIISDIPKCDIIWTENSDVIESFISEIFVYELSVIVTSTGKPWATLFTPKGYTLQTGLS